MIVIAIKNLIVHYGNRGLKLWLCNEIPSFQKTIAFIRELCRMIPGAEPKWRKRSSIKKMLKNAAAKGFTDVLIVNEDKRIPSKLCHAVLLAMPEKCQNKQISIWYSIR